MSEVKVLDLQDFVREVQSASERGHHLLANEIHTYRLLNAELARSRCLGSDASRLIALLKENAPSGKTDGGDLVSAIETARDTVKSLYDLVSAERGQAPATGAKYAELVAETAALHDRLNELAWLVGEHEADADEKLPGTFSSAEELLHAMGG